jgi:hypothetical protein
MQWVARREHGRKTIAESDIGQMEPKGMRVRHIVSSEKIIITETRWSTKDMPPKHAPIYLRTKPVRAGWQWKSAKMKRETSPEYILVAECNPKRNNWKAMLIVETDAGPSVVARFEYHGSHPGLHAHAHCERGGIEIGASSIDDLPRIPKAGRLHRRTNAWTESTFSEAAKRFFRIEVEKGPLGL